MAGLLWTLTADDPWDWVLPERVGVAIGEEVYLVPERQLARLSATRPEWLTDAESRALDRMEAAVHDELDGLFVGVHDRVPGFVDWYYSVPGATLRLVAAMPNPFWRNRTEFITTAIGSRLFPEDTWETDLEAVDRALGEAYRRELAALEAQWLAWLARELASYRQDHPLSPDRETVDFNRRLQAHLAQLPHNDHIGIQAAAGLGGGALLARAAIGRVNARAASARAATRLSSRGTAGASAAACGLTGPLAVGCGVLVFSGVILGTEWALLRMDEALHRDELEAALHRSVDALHESMLNEYGEPLLALFRASLTDLNASVQGSLRPIDRIRAASPATPEPVPGD
ncbi:hypothetical protein B1C78_05975 [Thioalkalivibrio denitrificans]|uniref:Uncharacterized protein n=2 Tax=Thioalkalivibrio denitrificans TaxID=108003 RepID=A0A1V3NKR5_9GAMM|nr:hypothetical protein B1C78_05975 [Thioalkalivibrio denitrificans]